MADDWISVHTSVSTIVLHAAYHRQLRTRSTHQGQMEELQEKSFGQECVSLVLSLFIAAKFCPFFFSSKYAQVMTKAEKVGNQIFCSWKLHRKMVKFAANTIVPEKRWLEMYKLCAIYLCWNTWIQSSKKDIWWALRAFWHRLMIVSARHNAEKVRRKVRCIDFRKQPIW